MKFFYNTKEDAYKFQFTDTFSVELQYLNSPYYSTLRCLANDLEDYDIEIHPSLAIQIKQYHKENSNNIIPNDEFISQLKVWDLNKVASHVSNELETKDHSSRIS